MTTFISRLRSPERDDRRRIVGNSYPATSRRRGDTPRKGGPVRQYPFAGRPRGDRGQRSADFHEFFSIRRYFFSFDFPPRLGDDVQEPTLLPYRGLACTTTGANLI